MSMKKLFTVLSVALFLFAPIAQSQPSPDIILKVPFVHQDTEQWCWVATAQMNIEYRNNGVAPKQCRMLELGYNLPQGFCCGNESQCTRSGYVQEIQALIGQLGGTVSTLTSPGNYMELYSLLKRDMPVIAQLRVIGQERNTHFVVIRGMEFHPDKVFVPGIGWTVQTMPFVLINDPLGIVMRPVRYDEFLTWWIASIVIGPHIGGLPSTPSTPSTSSQPSDPPDETPTPTPSSTLCSTLKRALASAPTFDNLRLDLLKSETSDEGVIERTYNAKPLPGMYRCTILTYDNGDKPDYSCRLNVNFSTDCEQNNAIASKALHSIKACLPDWVVKRRTTADEAKYTYDITSPDDPDGTSIRIHTNHFTSSDTCTGGLMIFP